MSGWTQVDSFFSSSAFSSGFFNSEVTMARLSSEGRQPSCSEALIMAVIYGRSVSANTFNKKVGIGSSGHDLVGDCMVGLWTLAALRDENADSDSAVAGVTVGGGRLSVAARTVFTLSSK